MQNVISKNLIFGIFLALISTVFSLIYQDIGVLIFPFFWLLLGGAILRIFTHSSKFSYSVFIISLTVAILYIYLSNWLYVTDPNRTYFFNNDSISHYKWTQLLFRWDKYLGPNVFDFTHTWVNHGSGFFIMSFYLGKIAKFIGSEYPLIVQITHVGFFYSLYSVMVNKLLALFFDTERAFKYTLYFIFLSPIFIYSAAYMRDIEIGLFYLIGFYILFKPLNIKNIIILLFLTFLCFLFRPTSGILYIILPIFYVLFSHIGIDKYSAFVLKFILGILMIPIILFVIFEISTSQIVNETLDTYNEYSEAQYEEADGLSKYINKLPAPLKGPANFTLANINPFPFTRGVHQVGKTTKKETSLDMGRVQHLTVSRSIGALFWFSVLYYLALGVYKGNYKFVDKKISYIFLLAIFITFLTTYSSPELRRTLGTLPMIYAYMLIVNQDRRLNFYQPLMVYMVVYILYFFAKYI